MKINDRIIAFTRVRARDLKPNPRNWRTHPPHQREALRGLLAEIGYADALLVRELPTGDLQLIDGHLRAETTPEAVVPVLVLDLNDDEADKLLAALDPLAALAERDDEKLADLIGDTDTSSPALRRFFDEILRDIETDKEADKAGDTGTSDEINIPDIHQVVVECASEAEQCALYQRLVDEGVQRPRHFTVNQHSKLTMPTLDFTLTAPVYSSFRVAQIAGMFDVPLADRATERISIDLPSLEKPPIDADWQIGLIVGPSASGKTSLARHLFGVASLEQTPWPTDRAVVDCFDDTGAREITSLLTAVGFSSPPSWIKSYHVLSNGERFRCDLARALSTTCNGLRKRDHGPCVFDEFTSLVDRNVARVTSAAVARALRGGRIAGRFVAITCHYDVAAWLEPDWTIDMATRTFSTVRLRRPTINLELVRCHRDAWRLFARHHYLTGDLSPTARCYLAASNGEPVAFCATIPAIGRRYRWRITRIVTLPDYQGIGIGLRVAEAVAELHHEQDHRITLTASHPSVVTHCRRSPRWRASGLKLTGSPGRERRFHNYRGSVGRAVVSFEFVPVGWVKRPNDPPLHSTSTALTHQI